MLGAPEGKQKGLSRRLKHTLIDVNLEKRERVLFELEVFKEEIFPVVISIVAGNEAQDWMLKKLVICKAMLKMCSR
jgi:hypothetical protein